MAAGIELCGSLSRWAVPLGAAMHEAGYEALGLQWRYVPFEIEEASLGDAVVAVKTLKLRGVGVSMPFKVDIIRLCDRLDPVAERIGAVNTLVNDDGVLCGHNTDWVGSLRALEEVCSLEGKRALLLGAGGAARAVAFGLVSKGVALSVSNRTESKARGLTDELGIDSVPWSSRGDLSSFEILVNATSIGMSTIDPSSPVPARALRADMTVLDAVYKPTETALVQAARRCGARTVDGGRMLLHQAAAQFELYTGHSAPLAAMDAALRAHLRSA